MRGSCPPRRKNPAEFLLCLLPQKPNPAKKPTSIKFPDQLFSLTEFLCRALDSCAVSLDPKPSYDCTPRKCRASAAGTTGRPPSRRTPKTLRPAQGEDLLLGRDLRWSVEVFQKRSNVFLPQSRGNVPGHRAIAGSSHGVLS